MRAQNVKQLSQSLFLHGKTRLQFRADVFSRMLAGASNDAWRSKNQPRRVDVAQAHRRPAAAMAREFAGFHPQVVT
jgi:hypothetical protein